MMINEKSIAVSRMQKYFRLIRMAAGMSMEELANRVGVTTMTISNIEHKLYPLSKPYYLAFRFIYNMISNEMTNYDLSKLIAAFVDLDILPEKIKDAISNRVDREVKPGKGCIGRQQNVAIIFGIVKKEEDAYFKSLQIPCTERMKECAPC